MRDRKPRIVFLLLTLAIVAGFAWVLRKEQPDGEAAIRMAGQVGIVAELLEATGRHLSASGVWAGRDEAQTGEGAGGSEGERAGRRLIDTEKNRLAFMQNSDCCAAVTTWGLGAKSLQGAIMCPDAAKDFLAANNDFVSAGPAMLNSDVFLLRAEAPEKSGNALSRVGISHKRAHQRVMAESAFGGKAELLEMLPVGLTYAFSKGEVDAVIVDLGIAAGTGQKYTPWKGEPLHTQELILSREFVESAAYRDFATAYALARQELLRKYSGSGLQMPPLKTEF